MPFRQVAVVLLALIAILGAGLFVLSIGDDEPDDSSNVDVSPGDESTTTTSSTSSTTTVAPITTSIPTECGATDDIFEATTTTTVVTTEPPADEEDGDEPPEEDPIPLVPTLSLQSSLSTVGLDEVTFGLTVDQATQAAGTPMLNCEAVTDCYRVAPEFAPQGISFVVHEGTIERVDIVGDSPITTRSGAGIGNTDDELDGLFGDRLERVDLGGGLTDVIFVPEDENDNEFRVAFTTRDGVVETMRSGRVPLVLEADPCG